MKLLFSALFRPKITILVNDMEFYAFHGCYAEERVVGSKFTVDVKITTYKIKACKTDQLKHAVNYAEVYRIVKEQMQVKSHLMEHLANRIGIALKKEISGIVKTNITVKKWNPPVGGQLGYAGISLEI